MEGSGQQCGLGSYRELDLECSNAGLVSRGESLGVQCKGNKARKWKTLENLGRNSTVSLSLLGILKTVRGRWVRKDTLILCVHSKMMSTRQIKEAYTN